jgi:hypothetical protein
MRGTSSLTEFHTRDCKNPGATIKNPGPSITPVIEKMFWKHLSDILKHPADVKVVSTRTHVTLDCWIQTSPLTISDICDYSVCLGLGLGIQSVDLKEWKTRISWRSRPEMYYLHHVCMCVCVYVWCVCVCVCVCVDTRIVTRIYVCVYISWCMYIYRKIYTGEDELHGNIQTLDVCSSLWVLGELPPGAFPYMVHAALTSHHHWKLVHSRTIPTKK